MAAGGIATIVNTFIAAILLVLKESAGVALDGCEQIYLKTWERNINIEFLENTIGNGTQTFSTVEGIAHINNIHEQSIEGLLVKPEHNALGCNVTDYGHVTKTNWIAFVQRGGCHFRTKGIVAESLGAKALLVYQQNSSNMLMENIPASLAAVSLDQEVGLKYAPLLNNDTLVKAIIHTEEGSNILLIVLASIMCPAAVLLNLGALVAIVFYPEKPKPHLYLIGNLILTDLLVAIVGTTLICLLYNESSIFEEVNEYTTVHRSCVASILSEIWDFAMLSNLFTLLGLTAEHFIAFRWPIKHKIVVTKQRVFGVITLSWLLSATPMVSDLIKDSLLPSIPNCPKETFCRRSFYYNVSEPQHSWVRALPSVIFVASVFSIMILVYGYVMLIVHRVSLRNPGFKKKGTALITTTCLIVSFALSYIFLFMEKGSMVVHQGHRSTFHLSVSQYFFELCPSCHLMLDFLFTGMIGAIMDPIIYCVRMKEVKSACRKLCSGGLLFRRLSFTSGSGYTRAAQNSVTVDENL